jgi:Na+/melibiose symporter-like transporter
LFPRSKDPNATPLDPVGAGLSIAGLTALVYGIIEAPSNGWTSAHTFTAIGAAAVLLTVFILWELRSEHPLLQMSFFKNPRFSAANVSISLVFFALFGSIFIITQYLQFVLGYTPLQAGVRVIPVATLIVASPLSARLVERFGSKLVVSAGLVLVSASLALLSTVSPTGGYLLVAESLALLGFGMGITMAPATDSIMGSLPLAKAGVGSAMNDTTRQVGGALGVAVLGSVLTSSYASSIAPALQGLPASAAALAGDSVGGATEVAAQTGGGAKALLQSAHAAFTTGMGDALLIAAGVAAAGAIIVGAFLPARAAPVAIEAESDDADQVVVGVDLREASTRSSAARSLSSDPPER